LLLWVNAVTKRNRQANYIFDKNQSKNINLITYKTMCEYCANIAQLMVINIRKLLALANFAQKKAPSCNADGAF
jgi:hypothetical protein